MGPVNEYKEEETGLVKRGPNGSRSTRFVISDAYAPLRLQYGNDGIPGIEGERFCATRHQYPQGLMRCSYGKVNVLFYFVFYFIPIGT
jgi:hypothetical protein